MDRIRLLFACDAPWWGFPPLRSQPTSGVLSGKGWNPLTRAGLPAAKAPDEVELDGQGLKWGYRQRLGTVLVPTTNDADWLCGRGIFKDSCCEAYAKAKSSSLLKSMHASVKFEGLDGAPHKDWDMRFNLIQHAKTYRGHGAWESLRVFLLG